MARSTRQGHGPVRTEDDVAELRQVVADRAVHAHRKGDGLRRDTYLQVLAEIDGLPFWAAAEAFRTVVGGEGLHE
jgi:hypothetical protein